MGVDRMMLRCVIALACLLATWAADDGAGGNLGGVAGPGSIVAQHVAHGDVATHSHGGSDEDNAVLTMVKKVMIPLIAMGLGTVCIVSSYSRRKSDTAAALSSLGKMAVYFGAQTGMNIYMKAVLSNSVVSEEHDLKGLPAAFAVVGIQQLTSFTIFVVGLLLCTVTGCYDYSPKKLTSAKEILSVCLFSLSFTMNIALNCYSLSLIPLSVNLIIRSCLPLSTFISQQVAAKVTGGEIKDLRISELMCMLLGVTCAAVAVVAEQMGAKQDAHAAAHAAKDTHSDLIFGVIVCIVSLFSGAVNLALAGVMGSSLELNALDTTVYMSIPAAALLVGPLFLYHHDVKKPWELYLGSKTATDWEIFEAVWSLSPTTVAFAFISGALALGYNVLQYGIVQSLSATHTAFAGNFNKAATIFLALISGLESLPEGVWGVVMMICVIGNISAFTAYNYLKIKNKEVASASARTQKVEAADDSEGKPLTEAADSSEESSTESE
eukprot:TRINITY_DN5804_c0_g1_i1.p1 TRINITY_DN5804_c0_g1~~TRINITY_DN5804_c0_g1_i1.p1  ORF type:complete len:494 (-),score=99.86 TRINITY_DN5804_c0_g1_i1:439-1920(-)